MSNEDGVVDQVEVDDNVSQPSASEVEAAQYGWVPQDQFKGDPAEWKDADTFLRRGKEINGFLRKENEKVIKLIQQRDKELAEIRETMSEFAKFHKETEAKAYQRALEQLKQEKAQAVEVGDGSRVVEIDDEIDKIKDAQRAPEPKPQTKPQVNDDWNQWASKNTWYGKDDVLTALANGFADKVKATNPDLVGIEFLNEVGKLVRDTMPEKFENPNRNSSAVAGSNTAGVAATGKKKTYNDLPAEGKYHCDKFVKQGLLTREQYVAEYFGE